LARAAAGRTGGKTSGRRAAQAVRKRPPFRREMILSAAAELFRQQGYRGTRLEDIGAAVGMTGPAVYRHFASKEALLAELLQRAIDRALRDVHDALEAGLAPRATLERIVVGSVAHAIEESDLVAMAEREGHNLSPAVRRRMSRQRRAILDDWVRALRAVRPELDERRAFAMVLGTAALITSWSLHRSLDEPAARELYARMAMAALLAR
jgi:AcrR family transcriptional regulator